MKIKNNSIVIYKKIFYTYTMKNIYFRYKHIKNNPKKFHLWDSIYIQMFQEKEIIGYANISFISQNSFEKYLKNPFDFFIYKIHCSNSALKKAYKHQNISQILTLLKVPFTEENLLESYQKFYHTVQKNYQKPYQLFCDYWVNKPSIDIITVFSEKDSSFIDYLDKQQKKQRNSISYKGKGYGKIFYFFITNLMHKKNYHLWESKTQTEDAKHIWNSFQKNQQFQLLSSSLFSRTCSSSITTLEEERKFLSKW